MSTDKDVYGDEPVDIAEILEAVAKNVKNVNELVFKVIPKLKLNAKCSCHHALDTSLI